MIALLIIIAVQLYRVLSVSHLHLILKVDEANPFLVDFPNPSLQPLTTSLCDSQADKFKYPTLLQKCRDELIPFIHLVDTSNGFLSNVEGTGRGMAIFVNLNQHTRNLPECTRITFVVSFDPETSIVIVFQTVDPFPTRKLLAMTVQQRYFSFAADVNPNMALLVKAITPEMNEDFNVDLHYGTLFIDSLERAAADDRVFANFKNPSEVGSNPQGLPISLFAVFFAVWYGKVKFDAVLSAAVGLHKEHPAVYRSLPELFRVDSIGAPVAHVMPYWLPSGDLAQLAVTPVQLRYALEASLLSEAFGSQWLSGKHVLEIGGGYGGMAVTLQTLHSIDRYSIVDLKAAGRLQQRYVGEVTERFPHLGRVAVTTVPSTSDAVVSSDLLISFFAISELRRDVVDRYMHAYVAQAENDYLQLNYDDPKVSQVVNENITKQVGLLYNMFEMFKLVYQVHPTAVMLPPPSFHDHHRIMWKQRQNKSTADGCDCDCDCDCGNCENYTGLYLQRLGRELKLSTGSDLKDNVCTSCSGDCKDPGLL